MQEKNAGGTPAAPIKLDVSVRVIEPVKNLMGFASVKFNDCFVVENLKIVQDEMHTEYISVSKHTIEKLIAHNGKAIAVGTILLSDCLCLFFAFC